MAVPKKRTSKSRKRMRRSHHHIQYSAAVVACQNCGELHLRHHICEGCGVYRGRQVLEVEED
ncbi:MAG: 50S ribosomal protein L32 [Alphaproteobacteria bacterium]|nr:50S ribosomal protein L32 [Alphaproteobacteria bacterium]